MSIPTRLDRWRETALRSTGALEAWRADPRIRRYALVCAASAFAVGLAVSIRHLPENLHLARPTPLVWIAALGVPAMVLINGLETQLAARLVGARFGFGQSVRIGLVSTAANLLPLPGGPIVRVAALQSAGASLLASSATTTCIAVTWLGLALGFAGCGLLTTHELVAWPLLGIGTATFGFACAVLYRVCRSVPLVLITITVKFANVVVGLVRTQWAFAALGLTVPIAQLAVFAVSGVAGSAVSIVPDGLGVNETAAALLAPLTGVEPSVAFLAVGLNRIVALPVMLAAASVLAMQRAGRHQGRPTARR